MQALTHSERQALVRHLTGDLVPEQPGALVLLVDGNQVGGPPGVQLRFDVGGLAEVRVHALHHVSEEHPPEDAGHLDRAARCLLQSVDAAEHEAVQRSGKLEVAQLTRIGGVDFAGVEVVDALLQVERVALRALDDE